MLQYKKGEVMAKELSDKKVSSVKYKSLKNIEENIGKILKGKGGNLSELVADVMKYNVCDTAPALMDSIPNIELSSDKNKDGVRGSYNDYHKKLWINTDYYDVEKMKENPQMIKELLCTVSHEMRHWYQYNTNLVKVENDTRELILSGKDDTFFKTAVENISNNNGIDIRSYYQMFKNVDREGLINDIKMLRMSPEDIRVDPQNKLSFLQNDEVVNSLQEQGDDYLRTFLAMQLNRAEYVSQPWELDARLTGTAESVNIISSLQESKNKMVKDWAQGIDIHQAIQESINIEDSNFQGIDVYKHFVNQVPMERLSQMLDGITNPIIYDKFKNIFLENKSQDDVERLLGIGLAKNNNCIGKEQVNLISKDRLKEMFDKNSITDFQNREVKLSLNAFRLVLDAIKGDLTNEEILQKAKESFADGNFNRIYPLQFAVKGGLEEASKFSNEMSQLANQNIDHICQFVKTGAIKEKDLNFFRDLTPQNETKINQAKIEYAKDVLFKVAKCEVTVPESIRLTGQMLSSFNSILKDGERKVGLGDMSNYFELTTQYTDTIESLIMFHTQHLSTEEFNKFDNKDDQKSKDLYAKFKDDNEMIDNLFHEIMTTDSWLSYVTNCRDLLGLLSEKMQQLKENLKDYKVEESKEEGIEVQQEEEQKSEEQKEDQTESENSEDDEYAAE